MSRVVEKRKPLKSKLFFSYWQIFQSGPCPLFKDIFIYTHICMYICIYVCIYTHISSANIYTYRISICAHTFIVWFCFASRSISAKSWFVYIFNFFFSKCTRFSKLRFSYFGPLFIFWFTSHFFGSLRLTFHFFHIFAGESHL